MSKRKGSRKNPGTVSAGVNIRDRVDRALREGRSKQALELAKELFRQEPTTVHRDLLRQAYLSRGQDLRERGAERDSVIVLKAALTGLGDDPEWLTQVAVQLALSGGISEVLVLLPKLSDPALQSRLLGNVADAAVRQGNASRAFLTPELQADFDRIIEAFAHSEAGRDDAAREALAGIGLRSPFLEWKPLIRGLLSYYAKDDARALENWQRLDVERLPARLAAPLRQSIDPTFRTAQSAMFRASLLKEFDRLQEMSLAGSLRIIRSALTEEDLSRAYRQAEKILPALRQEMPDLANRLASVFYWTVTETGPENVAYYQRIFGKMSLDPSFNRLYALTYERGGDFQEAHRFWERYEKDIIADPTCWPEGQAQRVRALIWLHMGQNAAKIPGPKKLQHLPIFLRELSEPPRPLKPTAEQCFLKTIELAPDLLEPYEALFEHHREEENDNKAIAAARQLLERFPDHVPTLEALADLFASRDKQIESLELYQRALRNNPLDRQLRRKTAFAHLASARLLAVDKQFDRARQEVQASLSLKGDSNELAFFCRASAIELKAGDTARGEEWLAQARQQAGSDLVVSFVMMTEVARLKLPKSFKTRFEGEFNVGLAAPPTAAAAFGLARTAAGLSSNVVSYIGQKTHQKKVLAYLERAKNTDFTEEQLQVSCSALLHLNSFRLARYYIEQGRSRFPKNPHFPYLEAVSYFLKEEDEVPVWKVKPLLERAERLARALPATEELKRMIDDIGVRMKALAAINPYAMGSMDTLFDRMFGKTMFPEDDFDDDFEDDDFEDDGFDEV